MGLNRLGKVHLALAAPSAVLFPIGIYMAAFYDRPALAIAAALLWLAGDVVFLVQIVGQFRGASTARASEAIVAVPAE